MTDGWPMMGHMEPADMTAAVTAAMQKRTDHTLDERGALVRGAGLDPWQQKDVRLWLRDVRGVGQNTQGAIADPSARRSGSVEPTVSYYADRLYAGAKASLRPLHDPFIALAVDPTRWLRRDADSDWSHTRSLAPLVRAAYDQDC